MTTYEDSDGLLGGENEPGGGDDDFLGDDALPLCPQCLESCDPHQYYCDKCGSNAAINPLTPYMPFVNIRFNYGIFCTMWRRLWSGKETGVFSRLVYAFMILLFVPQMVVFVLPILLICKIPQGPLRKAAIVVLVVAVIGLLVLLAASTPQRRGIWIPVYRAW